MSDVNSEEIGRSSRLFGTPVDQALRWTTARRKDVTVFCVTRPVELDKVDTQCGGADSRNSELSDRCYHPILYSRPQKRTIEKSSLSE